MVALTKLMATASQSIQLASMSAVLVKPKSGKAGDLLAEIQIVLPKKFNDDDRALIEQLRQRHPLDPRADLKW